MGTDTMYLPEDLKEAEWERERDLLRARANVSMPEEGFVGAHGAIDVNKVAGTVFYEKIN
jgi:hypothetical protein